MRGRILSKFYGKHIRRPEHIRPEDDPFAVGREMDVRFKIVFVALHIDETLRRKVVPLRTKKVEPACIATVRNMRRVGPVAAKQILSGVDIIVDGPLIPFMPVSHFLTGVQGDSRKKERL